MTIFQRLIRFLATDGQIYNGEALLACGTSDLSKATRAKVITGDIFGTHQVTDRVVNVEHLLAPLPTEKVRTVRCLGLNYAKHAKESGMALPKSPVLFVSGTAGGEAGCGGWELIECVDSTNRPPPSPRRMPISPFPA